MAEDYRGHVGMIKKKKDEAAKKKGSKTKEGKLHLKPIVVNAKLIQIHSTSQNLELHF